MLTLAVTCEFAALCMNVSGPVTNGIFMWQVYKEELRPTPNDYQLFALQGCHDGHISFGVDSLVVIVVLTEIGVG